MPMAGWSSSMSRSLTTIVNVEASGQVSTIVAGDVPVTVSEPGGISRAG
jgi:hypothetical protein